MMALFVWSLALAALVSGGTSLGAAGLARLAGPMARRVHPRTRARLWLLLTFSPALATLLVVASVLAPPAWLGAVDHCELHADHHVHLCVAHGAPWPSLPLVVLGVLFAARVGGVFVQRLVELVRAQRAVRRLAGTRLCLPGTLAFTAGWLAPRVFATAPVWSDPRFRAVLAHERDHARHRDPLARALARLALSMHLPVVAPWIEAQLVGAQELAADEAAATELGDRLEVAEQLVAWARSARSPAGALGASEFEEGDLSGRVGVLVDPPHYVRPPLETFAIAASAVGAIATGVHATHVHHAVETFLGALGA